MLSWQGNNLLFDDIVDREGELEVYLINCQCGYDHQEWINKDMAKQIIEHLQKVFEI